MTVFGAVGAFFYFSLLPKERENTRVWLCSRNKQTGRTPFAKGCCWFGGVRGDSVSPLLCYGKSIQSAQTALLELKNTSLQFTFLFYCDLQGFLLTCFPSKMRRIFVPNELLMKTVINKRPANEKGFMIKNM
jgi:hypothetical protein